jgi:hypothetical protein
MIKLISWTFVLIILVICFVINPIFGGVVLLVLIAIACASPTSCQICGNELRRNKYRWKIDGKKLVICPNCNRQLESKKSREAIKRLGL